jgi:replicative DNA helicase
MSLNAEHAVLGACLCSAEAYWRVADILVPEDFADGRLAKLYAMIRELARTNSAFDAVTITELEPRVLGPFALELANSEGWRVANIRAYAELVVQQAQARRIQAAGRQIAQLSGPEALVEAQRLLAACAPRHAGSVKHIREYLRESTVELQRRVNADQELTGIPTGLPELDDLTDGLQPGDLIVLAARPSVGKTAKAMQIAINAARHKVHTLVFSMEMTGTQLTDRVQAHVACVNATGLRRPKLLNNDDFRRLFEASAEINALPIQIDQTPALTVEAISARARQVHATSGLGLIVIDYLTLITLPKAPTTTEAIQIVTGALKRLAKELNVPLLCLSQLNRDADGKRPTLAELRGGGSIEQDADVVMFLWRPKEHKRNELVLLLDKQRNGETGSIALDADYAHMRFLPRDYVEVEQRQQGFGNFGRKPPSSNPYQE